MNTGSNLIIERLKEFLDNEARSCSMDFGCITPLYVYGNGGTRNGGTGTCSATTERGDRYMFRNNRSWLKYW